MYGVGSIPDYHEETAGVMDFLVHTFLQETTTAEQCSLEEISIWKVSNN